MSNEQTPAAWIRAVCTSPSGPWGPAEYDWECYPGEDAPVDNAGWQPLYLKSDTSSVIEQLRARNLEAARIMLIVRRVFGPVYYADDAEGETWSKIYDWLRYGHIDRCEFQHTGVCTCEVAA